MTLISSPEPRPAASESAFPRIASSRSVVFAVSLVVLLAMAAPFLDHTVDDAFISYRYAENLVRGHGLVFNPGERVEGYTNFLWVILVAPFLAAGIDAETAGRILGLAAAAGTLGAVVRLAPRPAGAAEVVWVAPILLAGSPPFALWATGGLEAPLFACLVLWAVALAVRDRERAAIGWAPGILAGAAALTRPEGALVALAIGAVVARRPPPGGTWRDPARYWIPLGAIVLTHLAWRLAYYGAFLPNTFHAKVGSEPAQILRGLDYLHRFLAESGYGLLLPLAGLLLPERSRNLLVPFAVAVVLGGAVVLVGGDGLPMYRFLVPMLPLLYLLAAHGTAAVVERLGFRPLLRAAVLVAVLAIAGRASVPAFAGPSALYVEQDRGEVAAWKAIGRYFAEHASAEASMAVITAGAMPYFSGLEAIDMLGLNDPVIARRDVSSLGRGQAGHEKHDVDYVLSRRPTYILIGVYGLGSRVLPTQALVRPFYPAEREMLQSPRFAEMYTLERGSTPSGDFAYFRRIEREDR